MRNLATWAIPLMVLLARAAAAQSTCTTDVVIPYAGGACYPAQYPAGKETCRFEPSGDQCLPAGGNLATVNDVLGMWSEGCGAHCPNITQYECFMPNGCRGWWTVDDSCVATCSIPVGRNCVTCDSCAATPGDEGLKKWDATCTSTTSCLPAVATQETCNDCDDDADGYVDNASGSPQNYTLQTACTNPNGCETAPIKQCQPGATFSACFGAGGLSAVACEEENSLCIGALECAADGAVTASCVDARYRTWCGDFNTLNGGGHTSIRDCSVWWPGWNLPGKLRGSEWQSSHTRYFGPLGPVCWRRRLSIHCSTRA